MENTSDAWHIPRYPTRKHRITSMYSHYKISKFLAKLLGWKVSIKGIRLISERILFCVLDSIECFEWPHLEKKLDILI